MTPRVLIASDLDRTLIYSAAAATEGAAGEPHPLVVVEHLDGRPLSYMCAEAAGRLAELARDQVVVPVTTRTSRQLARVRLPGPPPGYAVAANGGVLLVGGRPDAAWAASVRSAVGAVAPLDAAVSAMTAACDPAWAGSPRVAEDLFCYVVADRTAVPPGVLDGLGSWADRAGWIMSLQGRKLYLVPAPLTKSAAVAEVARRAGTGLTLAAGDSLLDIDLLAAADRGVRPGHGEIAGSGWSAPWVDELATRGVAAGRDIIAWFADRVAEHTADGGLRCRRPA